MRAQRGGVGGCEPRAGEGGIAIFIYLDSGGGTQELTHARQALLHWVIGLAFNREVLAPPQWDDQKGGGASWKLMKGFSTISHSSQPSLFNHWIKNHPHEWNDRITEICFKTPQQTKQVGGRRRGPIMENLLQTLKPGEGYIRISAASAAPGNSNKLQSLKLGPNPGLPNKITSGARAQQSVF